MAMSDKAQMFNALYRRHARNRAVVLVPLLEHAVSVDNADLLKKVLAIGACANNVHSNGLRRMLHYWVTVDGSQEALQALLDHGAVVDAPTATGRTALQAVAIGCKDNPGAATALLVAGANPNYRNPNNPNDPTALKLALGNTHMGVTIALIQYGANIHDSEYDGNTALHIAVLSNQVGAISVLVKAGANINWRGRNCPAPLHMAMDKNNPRSVRILRELGAEKNLRDGTGQTPLQRALTEHA